MKFTNYKLGNPGICLMLCALLSVHAGVAAAQAFGTTTVQGTIYIANGAPASGSLLLSWPAFTTAANQAVAAGRTTVNIGSSGFVSVNLAPNVGASPAGLYYTAVYHLSDGTTSTEYWVVPAAAQASLAQVRAQVMPAAQAIQAVNKAYVDQTVALATQSQLTPSGGSLNGPLYLNGDPVTSSQAATKHYVDNQLGQTLSINGGAASGPLTATQLGAAYQADQFQGGDFGAKLQACIAALNATYGGSCDARNFSGTQSMASNLTIAKANVTVNLPCATIATSSQIVVTPGTRNVTLHGCASRGTSATSGSQGGTVFLYSGRAAMIQVGDSTYATDTLGFHLDNVVLNTTSSPTATAQAVTVWRAQELHLESLYLLGNANQTGITLDGTGNYTGGTFDDVEIGGFQTAVNAVGHQAANSATTDWLNASTFVRLHINCPTSNGSAIAGTTGINLAQGDGNTITGGDVESCATALHLGPNAQNNTIVGLRNENSTYQVVADTGSAYNNWITGGTMFTGKLTDNGTRNSFLDTFHRSFNALNGDWFGSQQDSTLTNHFRLGIGSGNERGLLNRYQTDAGYRWTMGLSDAAAGQQSYQVLDELNNVNRLSIGQYNTGQGSSNNQTVINAAGSGAVVLNGSNNAGSGGVVFGSGGPSNATVATINNAGNAQFNGSLQVSGASTFLNSTTVKNQADAEIDAFLWAGATAPQKESVVYKDWNGSSQWYMVKDTSNNWALNSAVGGVDSFKAYQSTNSGDTYIDAANNAGVVRVNYEPGSGSAFNIYGGSSSNLYASFNGTTGIKFPGLASGGSKSCVQIDNSGYLSNTGSACAGSSVGTGNAGQFAYYAGNGNTLAGMTSIPVESGGTGASSSWAALASLGGLAQSGGTLTGLLTGTTASFSGNIATGTSISAPVVNLGSDLQTEHQAASANAAVTTRSVLAYGAKGDRQAAPPYGATISIGTNVVSCSGCTFANTDIGKSMVLLNAPSPVLSNSSTAPSVATIISVPDSHHVVLNRTAVVTATSLNIAWGTDNVPAFNACAAAGNGTCKIPSGNYLMASAPYYVIAGGYDDGSYGTPAGGSGAVITATLGSGSTAGQIVSYTIVNGGSGYTANSTLQMAFTGGGCQVQYNNGPCGNAYANATTNSGGVVTGVTPVYAGYGFTSAPTVSVTKLGGDGASATATLSGGSIGSTAMVSGGSGYGGNFSVYGIGGTGCAAIAGLQNVSTVTVTASGTARVTSGAVTSITWSNAGSGCSTAPTVIFGDYVCGSGLNQQCTNLAPLIPPTIPVQVILPDYVNWEGSSTSQGNFGQSSALYGLWDAKTVDNNQPAMFGSPLYVSQLSINGLEIDNNFIGILSPFSFATAKMSNNIFHNSGIGIYAGATDLGAQLVDNTFYGYSGYVGGGTWNTRIDNINVSGGFFNSQKIDGTWVFSLPYDATSKAIDDWFANKFWHPEYSASSLDFLETCKFPQTPNQRQTSNKINTAIGGGGNSMCYPGITQSVIVELTRNLGGSNGHNITNSGGKYCSRYLYYGNFAGGEMSGGGGCEQGVTLVSDPYRAAAIQHAPIVIPNGYGSDPNTMFRNINWQTSGTTSNSIWGLGSPTGIPVGRWESVNVAGTTANPAILNGDNVSRPLTTVNQTVNGKVTINAYAALNLPWFPVNTGPMIAMDCLPSVISTCTQTQPTWNTNGVYIGGVNNAVTPNADILDWYNTSGTEIYNLTSDGGVTNTGANRFNGSTSFNSGTAVTGTVGTGGKLQETTTATKTSGNPVAFDANGNTVNATAANLTSVLSAANIAALFSGCSGTQYLGADGACHTASTTYTLPVATTSVPGGVKCDGTTTTCAGDGTISAAISGSGLLTSTGGQTIAAANTTTGLTAGCVQYPCVVAKSSILYSAIATQVTLYTPTVAGQFRWCYFVDVTVAGTAGSWSPFIILQSTDGHSGSLGGSAIPVTVPGTMGQGCITYYSDASRYATLEFVPVGSMAGTPTTRFSWTVEQLQ